MIPTPFASIKNGKITISHQARQLLNGDEELSIVLVMGENKSGKSSLIKKVGQCEVQNNENIRDQLIMYRLKDRVLNPSHLGCQVIVLQLTNLSNLSVKQHQQITVFSLLLSSILIYNTKGNISQSNIHNLSSIISSAQSLICQSQFQQLIFPTLFWLLRDFNTSECFELPKEYMEKTLELQKGVSEQTQSLNRPKRSIKTYFKDRECFMLNHPDVKCQYSSFERQVEVLKEKLLTRARPLRINQTSITKSMSLNYAQRICQILNESNKVNLKQIHCLIRDSYNQSILKDNLKNVENRLDEKRQIRLNDQEMKQLKSTLIKQTITSFEDKVMGFVEQSQLYHNHLILEIESMLQLFCISNRKLWEKYYENMYHKLSDQYLKNIGTVKQVYIRLGIVKQEIVKITEDCSLREDIIGRLEGIWLRENFVEVVEKMLEEQRVYNEERHEELTSYTNNYQQYSEKVRQQLSSKVADLSTQITQFEKKVEDLQYKVYTLESTNGELQFTLQQRNNSLQTSNSKILQLSQQLQQKTQEHKLLSSINTSNNSQIIRLNQQLQLLQISVRKQETQLKTQLLERESVQSKLAELGQQIEEHIRQKAKLAESIQKQIIKNEKANIALIKQKQQIRKQQALIQQQQFQRKHNEDAKETESKHLQMKILELRHHMEEQDDINTRTIHSLKSNLENEIKKKAQLLEINQRLGEVNRTLQDKNRRLGEDLRVVKDEYLELRENTKTSTLMTDPCIKINGISSKHLKEKQNRDPRGYEGVSHISIKRTLIKQQNNKPFTVYQIQISNQHITWTIYKKYKQLCELHSVLKSIHSHTLSSVSFIVSPQQLPNKKSLTSEQRKRYLENYLNDLSKQPQISQSKLFIDFIEKPKSEKMRMQQNIKSSKKYL